MSDQSKSDIIKLTDSFFYRFLSTDSKDIKALQQLHKQARGYLKTTARLVGKDTSKKTSLFKTPYYDTSPDPFKEVLSKMTAITGHLLLKLWQENKDDKGVYTITNLSEIARMLGTSTQELKLYLIYLGGYPRRITKLKIVKKGEGILTICHDTIFHIKFNYKIRLKGDEKEEDFNFDARVGTDYLSFIKDRDIESVDIMPSLSLQEELAGGGLGNILVDDSFVAFVLGLSDLAYKLFCFSGSNKPTFKIGFNKLIGEKYLNLKKQLKTQGKPRVLKAIINGLTELKDKGHLAKWQYSDEKTGFFNWTYTDKVIKHKKLLKKKVKTLEIEALKPD